MQRSTREIEIKLPFASPVAAREQLERLGAIESKPREFEDNVVLDCRDGSLKLGDKVLRVRTRGEHSLLTLKTPVDGSHAHKVRNEYETGVADPEATVAVLRGLGYEPAWRYQKYRTLYKLGDLAICLDETSIGCFVELEGPPGQIDRAAERLGFTREQYVLASYRELSEREAARRGVPVTDVMLLGEKDLAP